MKLTKSGPLIDREIDWLEEVLMKYGNDDSVLCFSEPAPTCRANPPL